MTRLDFRNCSISETKVCCCVFLCFSSFLTWIDKKRSAVLEFFIVKLYMIANKKVYLAEYFGKHRSITVEKVVTMTDRHFEKMHQH